MIRHQPNMSTHTRPGTAATEFALALPLLMTLLLGCVDFGRVGYHAIALANATGAGARYGATHRVTDYTRSDWEQDIRNAVTEDFGAVPNFNDKLLSVTVETMDEGDGDVRVTVNAQYAFETIVNWPGLPHSIDLSQTVEFRQFR